jgi:DeoR/GlpR family transcriptional regulator of sugar metabolism
MKDRASEILNLLVSKRNVKVNTLAELLGVSCVTIRKDLDNLERRGLICRNHGYASLDMASEDGKRMAYNYSVKQRIARDAANTVKDGETIMIGSGSCCAFLVEELAKMKKNVTIITNSIFITNFVSFYSNIKLILLGGYYQPDSQLVVGPITVKSGEQFFSDKLFVDADGFLPDFGFSGNDYRNVQTIKELAVNAREVYVLAEAEIYKKQGVLCMVQFDQLTGVYTDGGISAEAEAALVKNNVMLYKITGSGGAAAGIGISQSPRRLSKAASLSLN